MRGFTTACLRDEGIVCSRSDLLTMEWSIGKRMGSVSLMRDVGIGSNEQDLEFPSVMNLERSAVDIDEKVTRELELEFTISNGYSLSVGKS